jgi:hypothetical protein
MDGWISSGNRFDGIKENGFVKSIREVGKHDSEYYIYRWLGRWKKMFIKEMI